MSTATTVMLLVSSSLAWPRLIMQDVHVATMAAGEHFDELLQLPNSYKGHIN